MGPDGNDEEETSSPVPLRWLIQPGGTLRGESQQAVVRPVTRFNTRRSRFVTQNENLGTLYVKASVRKQ